MHKNCIYWYRNIIPCVLKLIEIYIDNCNCKLVNRIVKYMCEEDAEKAINECNGILLDGTPLLCKRMVEKRPK